MTLSSLLNFRLEKQYCSSPTHKIKMSIFLRGKTRLSKKIVSTARWQCEAEKIAAEIFEDPRSDFSDYLEARSAAKETAERLDKLLSIPPESFNVDNRRHKEMISLYDESRVRSRRTRK